jgi:hypothetical protein
VTRILSSARAAQSAGGWLAIRSRSAATCSSAGLSRIDVWLEKRRGTKIKGIRWLRSGSLGACGVQGNILFGSSFSLSGPFIGNPRLFWDIYPALFSTTSGYFSFCWFCEALKSAIHAGNRRVSKQI